VSTALLVKSKRNGPIFLADREYGEWIVSAIQSLEQVAASLNIPTIDSFTYMDPDILQDMIAMAPEDKAAKMEKRLKDQQDWHSPEEGLKTIEALKNAVQSADMVIEFRRKGPQSEFRQALVEDLETVSGILFNLVQSNDLFRFESA